MKKYAQISVNEVLQSFNCEITKGLSFPEIAALRKNHGMNKLPEEEKVQEIKLLTCN